jgi:hypothetical protein
VPLVPILTASAAHSDSDRSGVSPVTSMGFGVVFRVFPSCESTCRHRQTALPDVTRVPGHRMSDGARTPPSRGCSSHESVSAGARLGATGVRSPRDLCSFRVSSDDRRSR